MDQILGIGAMILVPALFIGLAIYLQTTRHKRLKALPQEQRPTLDPFSISRFNCESVGGEHLHGSDGYCLYCGARQK